MSFAASLALVYLKICAIGVAIMVLLWGAAKVWLIFYNKYLAPQAKEAANDQED